MKIRPAPWSCTKPRPTDDPTDPDLYEINICGADGVHIALVSDYPEFLPRAVVHGNLLAAAPELLSAYPAVLALVRDAQDILSSYLTPDGHDAETACGLLLELLDGPRQRDAENSARAAIAKAKGAQ